MDSGSVAGIVSSGSVTDTSTGFVVGAISSAFSPDTASEGSVAAASASSPVGSEVVSPSVFSGPVISVLSWGTSNPVVVVGAMSKSVTTALSSNGNSAPSLETIPVLASCSVSSGATPSASVAGAVSGSVSSASDTGTGSGSVSSVSAVVAISVFGSVTASLPSMTGSVAASVAGVVSSGSGATRDSSIPCSPLAAENRKPLLRFPAKVRLSSPFTAPYRGSISTFLPGAPRRVPVLWSSSVLSMSSQVSPSKV